MGPSIREALWTAPGDHLVRDPPVKSFLPTRSFHPTRQQRRGLAFHQRVAPTLRRIVAVTLNEDPATSSNGSGRRTIALVAVRGRGEAEVVWKGHYRAAVHAARLRPHARDRICRGAHHDARRVRSSFVPSTTLLPVIVRSHMRLTANSNTNLVPPFIPPLSVHRRRHLRLPLLRLLRPALLLLDV